MESINKNAKMPTDATHVDAEEISFCNCENNACETPYQAEDIHASIEEQDSPAAKKKLARGYQTVKQTCRATANRLKKDWKQTGGGPYLKQTASYRLELDKDRNADTPVDRFSVEKTNTCALRTLLLAAAGTVATMCVLGCIASGKKKE